MFHLNQDLRNKSKVITQIFIKIEKNLLTLKTSKCWVWFKGSLNNGGYWKEGFTCTFDENPGVLIESPAYVTCRVPTWRVLTKEPENLYKSPLIPDKAIWKII